MTQMSRNFFLFKVNGAATTSSIYNDQYLFVAGI